MKPYKARTLKGAERRVRELMERERELDEIARTLQKERRLLAMLAAEGPCFDNPLVIAQAKEIRDCVLRHECKLAPDGKFLN